MRATAEHIYAEYPNHLNVRVTCEKIREIFAQQTQARLEFYGLDYAQMLASSDKQFFNIVNADNCSGGNRPPEDFNKRELLYNVLLGLLVVMFVYQTYTHFQQVTYY